MESNLNLKAIIIGATGAVGRELVDYLLNNDNYSKVTIIVRRMIDRWVDLPENKKNKLNIIEVDSLDCISNIEQITSLLKEDTKYDVLFNTLGSRVGRGKDVFYKVDYTYVVDSCTLCEQFNISHFSNCSAGNADKNSCFYYSQVKGQAEDACLEKNVNYISIMRPGIITDRDNDSRCMESFIGCLCCCWRISSKEIALAMMIDDLDYQKGEKEGKKIRIDNSTMKTLAQRGMQYI